MTDGLCFCESRLDRSEGNIQPWRKLWQAVPLWLLWASTPVGTGQSKQLCDIATCWRRCCLVWTASKRKTEREGKCRKNRRRHKQVRAVVGLHGNFKAVQNLIFCRSSLNQIMTQEQDAFITLNQSPYMCFFNSWNLYFHNSIYV